MNLDLLLASGAISALDLHFARTLVRLAGDPRPEILAGAVAASAAPLGGQVCAELTQLAGTPLRDADGEPVGAQTWPPLEPWLEALRSSPAVGSGEPDRPLVLDGRGRLYLHRYWSLERDLARRLLERAGASAALPEVDVSAAITRIFPNAEKEQAQAIVAASRGRLTVVSGGPGTGKTTTVVRMLALLQEREMQSGRAFLQVMLMAPTGKAAARLVESIQQAKAGLEVDETVRASIPETASTIHRALGVIMARPGEFRHDVDRPLPADLVVVDEASMVDLALMSRLVRAIPPHARLVLLGDQDQLASVEAGAILGDICNAGRPAPQPAPAIGGCIVKLGRSRRFKADGGIGALAAAIQRGDAPGALQCLDGNSDGVTTRLPDDSTLEDLAVTALDALFSAAGPAEALAALGRFRVLCAHRQGHRGVEAVNERLQRALSLRGRIPPTSTWFKGRPVMVTRNDYGLQLFNGDIGVAWDTGEGLRVHFPTSTPGELRAVHPARLPPHETVFAMTVHKSQGSEFDAVLVVLPEQISPILTMELLYTAVTRARERVTVLGSPEVIAGAVGRRVRRASGLRDALWEPEIGGEP